MSSCATPTTDNASPGCGPKSIGSPGRSSSAVVLVADVVEVVVGEVVGEPVVVVALADVEVGSVPGLPHAPSNARASKRAKMGRTVLFIPPSYGQIFLNRAAGTKLLTDMRGPSCPHPSPWLGEMFGNLVTGRIVRESDKQESRVVHGTGPGRLPPPLLAR